MGTSQRRRHDQRVDPAFFVGGKTARCFFCTQTDVTYDIKAVSAEYRACKRCVTRRGVDALKNGANEAIAYLSSLSNKECRHCGVAMIQPARGFAHLLCGRCIEEWRSLAV